MMEIVGIDEGFTHVDDDRIFHEKKLIEEKKMRRDEMRPNSD